MLDLRLALRRLGARPAMGTILVLTFALAIGASATVFALVDALLLAPMPFADAGRLVVVRSERGGQTGKLAPLEVEDIARGSDAFVGLATFRTTQYNVSGEGRPEAAGATMCTHDLFALLGVRPYLGETWAASVDRTTSFLVVVSYEFWQRRLGGDPAAIGRSVILDSHPYQVIAVMPPGFAFPTRSELWRRAPAADYESRAIRAVGVVARLAPGVTPAVAQAQLDRVAERLAREHPDTNTGVRYRLSPLRAQWLGDGGEVVWLLAAAVVVLLLVACANVAGVLLAAGLARRQELAVRAALGATRRRLVRQLVVETLVVAALGGALGLGLALAAGDLLPALVPVELPRWMELGASPRLVAAAAAVTLVAGLAAGAWPALAASRVALGRDLKEGRRAGARRGIVSGQIALCFALAAVAALLVGEYLRLAAQHLGIDAAGVLSLKIDPPWSRFERVAQTAPLYERVEAELRAIPGVTAVASNDALPVGGRDATLVAHRQQLRLEGLPPDEEARRPFVSLHLVSPGYRLALGLPLVAGRFFTVDDHRDAAPVAVVSAAAARALWPGGDPLGRRLALRALDANYTVAARPSPAEAGWATVVGVVGDVRPTPGGPAALDVYLSDRQRFAPETYYFLRAAVAPASLLDDVARAIARVDPELAVFDVRPLAERVVESVWQRRAAGAVLGGFALLAVVLAAVGVYGVTAHVVATRTRELGVRMALGASPRRIAATLLREAGLMIAWGLGGGALLFALAVAALPVRLDPTAAAVAALAVAGAALAACVVPALRAARLSPLAALRRS